MINCVEMGTGHLTLVMVMAVATMLAPCINACSHIVGGRIGWAVPPNATYYHEWAAPPRRVFGVGDKLVFHYRSGQYNVYQVNKNDYDHCTKEAPIAMYARGPTIYHISSKGDYYFFSAIAKHCELGTKLHISVTSDSEGTSEDHFSFKLAADQAAQGPSSPHDNGTFDGKSKTSAANTSAPASQLGLACALLSLMYIYLLMSITLC